MTDAKEYSIGANAKLAGLEYDPGRSIDWRMGWLEERPERNRGPNIPDDWVRQTMAYRQQVLREPQDVTMTDDPLAQGPMTQDAMRSAVDGFKSELGSLDQWNGEALGYLLVWMEGLKQSAQVAIDNLTDAHH